MKILLDPILTAMPKGCSTTVQFVRFVEQILTVEQREDVFFYWIVPDWVPPEEFRWYPQHDHIRYIRVPQHKDRTKEYLTMRDELDYILAFNGDFWDFDIVLTVRSGLVPLMRLLATSPRLSNQTWMKEFWLIEEMPLMKFKKTVMNIDPPVQDRYTIEGYLAADRVYILSEHEKAGIIQSAKNYFSPSTVLELADKIKVFVPVKYDNFEKKPPERLFTAGTGMKFGIGYAGRMEMANNIEVINDIMEKQFIVKGDDVHLIVCTVSQIIKEFDNKIVDIRFATREEFWDLARNDMHVLIMMPKGGSFNMSLLEPLMLGTPAIVLDADWSRPMLGENYPFYVKNKTEAYALLMLFYRKYEQMYKQFLDWHKKWFVPTYTEWFRDRLLATMLSKAVDEYQKKMKELIRPAYKVRSENPVVHTIMDWVKDRPDFVLFDVIREIQRMTNDLPILESKTAPRDRDRRNLIWSTDWYSFKWIFKEFFGYDDASTVVGHFKKVEK
jgi:glycosyltransferase involved in cell wall biosynthesis